MKPLLFVITALLIAGCASTPEQRQADEARETTQEQEKASREQEHWRKVLAPYSDEQLRSKFASAQDAVKRGTQGINILLQQGNGIGVLIAQGQVEAKVKERDAIALELDRRGGTTKTQPPVVARDEAIPSQPKATGTGFFITEDGYFVTCQHVVNHVSAIKLQTATGLLPAEVVRQDAGNDLAVLKVTGAFSALPVVPSRLVKQGEGVFTIGFPNPEFQGRESKLTRGGISSVTGNHDDPRYFQISVPIQPGNSGGALVDERGNVVGVVSAKFDARFALATTGQVPENVNYAVKSSLLNTLLESLPEVASKLKEAHVEQGRPFDDVVGEARAATAIVLIY
ncbi:MAG: hypothetical protein JWR69_4448 [Pedosphaera sp.]|nr:hypothetical protein [Pedosphaera sp.]